MRFLIDTHVFLWAASDESQLSNDARIVLGDRRNEIFVSAAVSWEIVIKHALHKLTLPLDPSSYVPSRIKMLGFARLDISTDHALAVASLPDIHNDPFDRIMVAQAQVEGMTFITRDRDSLSYPVASIVA